MKFTSSTVFVIAEAAESHYGDFARAKRMCELAAKSGAHAIKFQHHIPSEEMLKDVPMSSNMREPLYEFLERTALGIAKHVELRKYCDQIGIMYMCTPFSLMAARELEQHVNPEMYKIGSGELTDIPTLLEIAKFGKPMIVSTGMSEFHEIRKTYDALIDKIPQLILMNCTSAYPPKPTDIRLQVISILKTAFPRALIGHSDHTNRIYTSIGAIALGANFIEKHVTEDIELLGPDEDVSITFDELAELISNIPYIIHERSGIKELLESEKEIQAWARRSLVYLKDLKIGDVVTEGDIWGKRPGTGIPSAQYSDFIGRKLTRNVTANTLLNSKDF